MSEKGARLQNSGWTPCEKANAFAVECGLDPEEIWADFHDYWTAKAGANACKLDWLATWRNWCRRNKNSRAKGISSRFERKPTTDAVAPGPRMVWVGGRGFGFLDILPLKHKQASGARLDPDEQRALEAWNG